MMATVVIGIGVVMGRTVVGGLVMGGVVRIGAVVAGLMRVGWLSEDSRPRVSSKGRQHDGDAYKRENRYADRAYGQVPVLQLTIIRLPRLQGSPFANNHPGLRFSVGVEKIA